MKLKWFMRKEMNKMFELKKDVTFDSLDEESQKLLSILGFESGDNLSQMAEDLLKKKGVSLNEYLTGEKDPINQKESEIKWSKAYECIDKVSKQLSNKMVFNSKRNNKKKKYSEMIFIFNQPKDSKNINEDHQTFVYDRNNNGDSSNVGYNA